MKNILDYFTEDFNNKNNGDEFYTQIKDIEKELNHYNLSNKIVYCNCDNPAFSNFYKYLKDNFKKLKLKRLIATYFDKDPKKYTYDGTNEKSINIKSGKFQDNEDILKECDIVITNPPYSNGLPAEFIDLMFKYKKDFIIVGPLHLCTNKKIFSYIKDNKINTGYSNINSFIRPNGELKNAPSCWWTNIKNDKKFLQTGIKYKKSEYKKYDNYDAIDCNPYTLIPDDYNEKIGVSYRFLTHINYKQFKIIDLLSPKLNGKTLMKKLIIQRK